MCIGSTPLFYIGHDVECMRGKKIGDVLHRFMFAVTDFKVCVQHDVDSSS